MLSLVTCRRPSLAVLLHYLPNAKMQLLSEYLQLFCYGLLKGPLLYKVSVTEVRTKITMLYGRDTTFSLHIKRNLNWRKKEKNPAFLSKIFKFRFK